MLNQMHILLHATKKKSLTCFRQFQSFNVRNYNFDRNSRQASTFSINRALLVLFHVSYLSYPNLLRPSHETHLLAFPTLCLAFQQINLTPLQPIRSTQFADIFDSLPRPFSLYIFVSFSTSDIRSIGSSPAQIHRSCPFVSDRVSRIRTSSESGG